MPETYSWVCFMSSFFERYLVFPLSFLLSGFVGGLLLYHPALFASLSVELRDLIALSVSQAVVAVWLLVWERRLEASPFHRNRRQKSTDLAYAVFSGAIMSIGHILILQIPGEHLLGQWTPVAEWAVIWQILAGLLFHDLLLYWWHRGQHESGDSFLWRVHRPHHTPQRLHVLSGARNHFIDLCALVTALAITRCFGFTDEAMFWITWYPMTLGAAHHCNLDIRLGRFNYLIPGPEMHRVHHCVDIAQALNYAPSVPLWDAIFGTLGPRKALGAVHFGTSIGDDREDTFVTTHLHPFSRWGAMLPHTKPAHGSVLLHPGSGERRGRES